jgi:anti-sigma factor RsiW
MSCNELPIERLVAHVDGELPAAEAERVAAHLAACADCAREADLLRRSGDLIERLPGLEPDEDFTRRVVAAARPEARRGTLLRLWPAAAAAGVLVAVLGARIWLGEPATGDAVLSAREEREIAADLYVLANLEALEQAEADELISLVEELDLLEGSELEVSGLFADDGEEGG